MSYKVVLTVALIILACLKPSEESFVLSHYRLGRSQCLSESLSTWQKPSVSLIDCFVSSREFQLNSVGVVQRTRRNASCALFRFSQVCHLLSLFNISSSTAGLRDQFDCEIIVDSEYDAITANEHFSAVWVGDRGPALENVVCGPGGQRNPMRSSNVTWTSEGARMDGVSSRLWVDDPVGLDFSGSYTWVLHLKRTPKQCCFIELNECQLKRDLIFSHFWEFSDSLVSKKLYLNPMNSKERYESLKAVLPTDSEQLIVVGVVFDSIAVKAQFFIGSNFLPDSAVLLLSPSLFPLMTKSCLQVGWRDLDSYMLQGSVRAVAVANTALSESQIRMLFHLL